MINLKDLPTLWPTNISWPNIFNNNNPIDVEIGSGRPHFFFDRALNYPQRNIIGIEYKHEFIAQAKRRIIRENIKNALAIHGNAWLLVPLLFGPNTISQVFVNFPDPWWKTRHKRRLVLNNIFLDALKTRMKPDGFILLQTDVKELFEFYKKLIDTHGSFAFCETREEELITSTKAKTHREKKCLEKNMPIYRGIFRLLP
jgi:tRNA (guanine-N7-)-methyltransferase